MRWRARPAVLRLVVGVSVLIPALGCCCGPLICRARPVESAPCCPGCGRVFPRLAPGGCRPLCAECSRLARCNCFFCRLRWAVAGPCAAGMSGHACAPRVMETPFPRFHPVPKRPVFSTPAADGDVAIDRPDAKALTPEPEAAPHPDTVTPKPETGMREPEKAPSSKAVPAPLPQNTPAAPPRSTDGWRPVPRKTAEQAGSSSWVFRPVSNAAVSDQRPAASDPRTVVSEQKPAISDQQTVR
jgi:hypothetical protein